MIRTVCITITGRVQGVFFRQSAMETAIKLKLNGFVRNLADGAVYIEAQGAEEQLKSLIAWCHKGPPLSRVEEVRIEFSDIPERYNGFTIIR